ncbi:duf1620 domain-containing protein [Colletotrichum plurivorum]|uniref:Duf1620 domain-containing protein n=1 Tax=Colletotrichum plurivorum TaxID=2175906 RepID=A0A8H6U4T3_9PEZI|nr:duf1620 domain-containing protein [Colletotrichum plurivorum]
MVNSFRSLTSLAVLSGLANARLYDVPEATTVFNLPLDQFSPQPTKAPAYVDLKRRQASTITTVLVAPDNTCGYISGRAGAAYTCAAQATCVFFTALRNNPGRVACCNTDECGARRTCFDQKQVSSSSLCNDGCLIDTFTLKCTNSAAPFCNTVSFSGSIFDYWCNTVEISTALPAVTSYDGETGRTWVPLPLDETSSSVLKPPTASGRFTGTATGSPSDPSPSSGTVTDADGDVDSNKTSTPVGAIVGGVIGGLAVIALVGLGIFLILRKKKELAQGQQPPGNQQPMTQGGYQPAPQGSPTQYAATTHTQSLYDPKIGGAQGGYPQSYGGTPPPQGGYQQPGYFAAGNMVPDRADTTSPGAVSELTDNRYSTQTIPGFQQQPPQQQFTQPQPTIHEAPANNEGHRGQMHELA